ncbi:hypothetical protein GC169_04995 [bacterium]|nr:hypothetical protein [bacterium]
MAKATFHKNQKVFVKPVGTWAIVERVSPQWVKGLDEPLKVLYDVGLGREFSAAELVPDRPDQGHIEDGALGFWRVLRVRNRLKDGSEGADQPFPGTFPVVATDEKNWGGWRVPSAEYDRDPEKVEFQARMIEATPHLFQIAKTLARQLHEHTDDLPLEMIELGKQAETVLRRIHETPADPTSRKAAE